MTQMTEDQAKTKRCPIVGLGQHNCIASDCMAWKFIPREHSRETELWSRSKNMKVNSAWRDDSWWKPIGRDADKEPPAPVGFCGAFSKTIG